MTRYIVRHLAEIFSTTNVHHLCSCIRDFLRTESNGHAMGLRTMRGSSSLRCARSGEASAQVSLRGRADEGESARTHLFQSRGTCACVMEPSSESWKCPNPLFSPTPFCRWERLRRVSKAIACPAGPPEGCRAGRIFLRYRYLRDFPDFWKGPRDALSFLPLHLSI